MRDLEVFGRQKSVVFELGPVQPRRRGGETKRPFFWGVPRHDSHWELHRYKNPFYAAVAQLYLGSMMFFAAREAPVASGFVWRLSSPS